MSSAANETHEMLRRAMKSVCLVYNVLPQVLLKAVEQSGEGVSERVHYIISPPYILHWIAEM